MCSRFENKETGLSIFTKISKEAGVKVVNNAPENIKQINIFPADDILIIKNSEGALEINKKTWGIKFEEKSPLIFNSRIETIKSKTYWNNIFSNNRCLIPATAFYEWVQTDKIKIPNRISLDDFKLFFMAGIFIKIKDNFCASVITTAPNTKIASIHNRMPVILLPEDGIKFLNAGKEEALKQCEPLNDKIGLSIEVADDILTQKQKKELGRE
ncbi:MAG: SOS response-associated peptidase [Bacteroidetes bacterium]|nr:SOS response-associated peptidase [Bacteroidota bacterium]